MMVRGDEHRRFQKSEKWRENVIAWLKSPGGGKCIRYVCTFQITSFLLLKTCSDCLIHMHISKVQVRILSIVLFANSFLSSLHHLVKRVSK